MSGVVHGLLRARGFTQDDAHAFCTKEQVVDEVVAILELVDYIMSTFGFTYEAEISTRPEKSIGTDDMWEHATDSLKKACEIRGLAYDINEGDGAFDGPKIDIKVKDAIGRTWQCSTVRSPTSICPCASVLPIALPRTPRKLLGCCIAPYSGLSSASLASS